MRILSVENVISGYGSMEVLHGVSLNINKGEIVSLLGPNGSGKTTLVRTVFGIVKPWKGSVQFKGDDISGLSAEIMATKGICYVPQEENVFPALTINENLEMGAFVRKDDWSKRIEEVYELFPDIANRRNSRAGELSGGMRQMLAIGRALMLNPELLILDEPSSGLAPVLVDHIFNKIQTLNEQGVTIFLVEQNAQALSCSHRSYIFEGGEKKAEGKASDLMNDEEIGKLYLGR